MNIKSMLVEMLLKKERIALSPMIAEVVCATAEKKIRDKFGADMKIRLNELNILNQNGNTYFHLNAQGDMDETGLQNLFAKVNIPLLGEANVSEKDGKDEINITSELLTGAASVVLGKIAREKTGIDINIWLNKFGFINRAGNAHFRLSVDGDAKSQDILKLIG